MWRRAASRRSVSELPRIIAPQAHLLITLPSLLASLTLAPTAFAPKRRCVSDPW